MDIAFRRVDSLRGFTQRNSGCQVERESYHRKLPLVIDGQRGVLILEMRESGKRNLCPAGGFDINILQRIWVLLKLRADLEHHVILIQLGEDSRNLALSERVVQNVINGLRQDTEPRSRVAVYYQICFQAIVLLVARDIPHLRQG